MAAGSPDRILRNGPQVAATSFGYQGMSMIAVAGRDMAARDAPARAAGRAGLCAAGRQCRPCAGVQQQWPRVESPDGLASEVVELSKYAGFNCRPVIRESRRLLPSGNPSCTTRRTAASARGRGPARRSQARPIQIAYAQHIPFVLAPAGRIDNVPSEMILCRDNACARTLNESNIVIPRLG